MISDSGNGKTERTTAYVESTRRQSPIEKSRVGIPGWIWFLLFIVVVGVGGFIYWKSQSSNSSGAGSTTNPTTGPAGGKARGGPIPVVTDKARKGNIDIYLNGLGTVIALNTVSIHSRVDGQLLSVNYAEGQNVKTGDLLVQIDPRPYEDQKTQAEGQLIRDQALLKNAIADLDRYTKLFKEQLSVTEQQVVTQQALVDQYKGTVKTDEGQVAAAELNIEYCHITAPIDGRIGLRMVDVGNIVHATDVGAIAVLTQVKPITVVFTLPEDNIPHVMKRLNPKQPLTVEAWDRALTQQVSKPGKLIALDNQVDVTTGMVRLRAQYDNDDLSLFPNQFVNARLLVERMSDVVVVDAAAIQRGPDFLYVYVVKDDKTVELRKPIVVGPTEAGKTVIESGIQPGELVVVDGVDKLQPGSQVSLRERTRKPRGAATTQSSDDASGHRSQSGGKHGRPSTQPAESAAAASPEGASSKQHQSRTPDSETSK